MFNLFKRSVDKTDLEDRLYRVTEMLRMAMQHYGVNSTEANRYAALADSLSAQLN